MLIDHARVSTDDQKLNRQMDALQQAGCAKIYSDRREWSQSCKTWTEPSTRSSTGRQCWGLSSNRAETYAKAEILASTFLGTKPLLSGGSINSRTKSWLVSVLIASWSV